MGGGRRNPHRVPPEQQCHCMDEVKAELIELKLKQQPSEACDASICFAFGALFMAIICIMIVSKNLPDTVHITHASRSPQMSQTSQPHDFQDRLTYLQKKAAAGKNDTHVISILEEMLWIVGGAPLIGKESSYRLESNDNLKVQLESLLFVFTRWRQITNPLPMIGKSMSIWPTPSDERVRAHLNGMIVFSAVIDMKQRDYYSRRGTTNMDIRQWIRTAPELYQQFQRFSPLQDVNRETDFWRISMSVLS